jgi:hypothetical protein
MLKVMVGLSKELHYGWLILSCGASLRRLRELTSLRIPTTDVARSDIPKNLHKSGLEITG